MHPQEQNCVRVEQGVCPNCGYCPHCGRANAQPPVHVPSTWSYAVPAWQPPFTITCEIQTSNNAPVWVWHGQPLVTDLSVAT